MMGYIFFKRANPTLPCNGNSPLLSTDQQVVNDYYEKTVWILRLENLP